MLWQIITIGAVFLFIIIPLFIFLLTGVIGAPYVPSNKEDLAKAFTELYTLGEKDLLVDLGCGDGTVVNAASEYGAKAVGVEINPFMLLYCKFKYRKNKKLRFKSADMYNYHLPHDTTVAYLYSLPHGLTSVYTHLKKEATRLDRTIYLISNAFDLKNVKPYKHEVPFYLYRISPNQNDTKPKR